MQNEEIPFDPEGFSQPSEGKIMKITNDEMTIRGLKLALLMREEEIKSLTNRLINNDATNKALYTRMNILSGMFDKSYDEVKVYKDEITQLRKLRHCINCKSGSHEDDLKCKYCVNCDKWEAE